MGKFESIVYFDKTKLEFQGIESGSIIYNKSNDITIRQNGSGLNILYCDYDNTGTSAISSNGLFCRLKFKALVENEIIPIQLSYSRLPVEDKFKNELVRATYIDGLISTSPVPLTLKLSNATCKKGDIANVDLSIANVPKKGVYPSIFDILFDKSKLELIGIENGSLIQNKSYSYQYFGTPYGIKIFANIIGYDIYDNTKPLISSDGLACRLKFKALGENESVPLYFYYADRFYDKDYYDPIKDAFFINGAINIINTYCDGNNDNIVDSADYSLLNKYLIDKASPESIDSTFAAKMDLYVDNTIDTADYMVLKRFLLGKIDTLPVIPSEYGKAPTPTTVPETR